MNHNAIIRQYEYMNDDTKFMHKAFDFKKHDSCITIAHSTRIKERVPLEKEIVYCNRNCITNVTEIEKNERQKNKKKNKEIFVSIHFLYTL